MNDRRSNDGALASHEKICAERYEAINMRLGRMEAILVAVAGTIICALVAALWQTVK